MALLTYQEHHHPALRDPHTAVVMASLLFDEVSDPATPRAFIMTTMMPTSSSEQHSPFLRLYCYAALPCIRAS